MKRALQMAVVSVFAVLGLASAPVDAAPYCGIAWGSLPKTGGAMTSGPLTNIRTGRHECFDRMVFDFRGTASGYNARYVSNVYADGSGQLIPLAGGAKLEIIALAPSYDVNGNATYPAVIGSPLPGVNLAGYQTFRDAKYAGSFEGQTTIGLGVRAQLPFKVHTLDSRLVVDVAHKW